MAKKLVLEAIKRRDGRYSVTKSTGGYLNGDEKVKYLVEKGLAKAAATKKAAPVEEPAAEEAPAAE